MKAGPEAMRSLVLAGAELLLEIYLFPRPVVAACTGHAMAAGALLLLSADLRVGSAGAFKIGLNEVAIGMTLPIFALELARDRIAKPHLTAAVTQAQVYDPEAARQAGYLDLVVNAAEVVDTAVDHARRLAMLPDPAFRNTKARERGATVKHIRAGLAEDIATLAAIG
jgi:enoyl-CoA hydratase